ncbi:MAG: SRPBCC family protein, partial [Paracoccaceae bacterium]|nr:SRPBCC family protein [Paracoccaceae bacterium]
MIRAQRNHIINATPDEIWAVLSRYMHIDEFCAGITHVDALTTGEDGVGSKRRNNFADDNGSMVEEVIEWTVNRGYKVRMSEMTKFPAKEAVAFI